MSSEVMELECGFVAVNRSIASKHSTACDVCEDIVGHKVTPDKCEEWRQRLVGGESTVSLCNDSDVSKTTVLTHILGECNHDLEFNPVFWDNNKKMWVIDDS